MSTQPGVSPEGQDGYSSLWDITPPPLPQGLLPGHDIAPPSVRSVPGGGVHVHVAGQQPALQPGNRFAITFEIPDELAKNPLTAAALYGYFRDRVLGGGGAQPHEEEYFQVPGDEFDVSGGVRVRVTDADVVVGRLAAANPAQQYPAYSQETPYSPYPQGTQDAGPYASQNVQPPAESKRTHKAITAVRRAATVAVAVLIFGSQAHAAFEENRADKTTSFHDGVATVPVVGSVIARLIPRGW
jgi:hypothetical protein